MGPRDASLRCFAPNRIVLASHPDGGHDRASLEWLSALRPITAQKSPGTASSTFVKINVNE